MGDYADHGVKEYWIVDADHRIVEQYFLTDGVYSLSQKLKDGKLESEINTGFSIEVSDIFTEE